MRGKLRMEPKVNEVFSNNGAKFKCIASASCDGCAFNQLLHSILCDCMECAWAEREDGINVIFVQVEE